MGTEQRSEVGYRCPVEAMAIVQVGAASAHPAPQALRVQIAKAFGHPQQRTRRPLARPLDESSRRPATPRGKVVVTV